MIFIFIFIFIFTCISLHACMKRACTEIFVLSGFWWCKTFPWGLGFVGVCKIDSWEAELELRAMACLCGAFGRATSCGKPGCVFSSRSYWAGKTELVFSFSFFWVFLSFHWFFLVTAKEGCPLLEGKLFASCNSWWNWSSATCTPTGVDKLLVFFLPPPTCNLLQIWSELSWAELLWVMSLF